MPGQGYASLLLSLAAFYQIETPRKRKIFKSSGNNPIMKIGIFSAVRLSVLGRPSSGALLGSSRRPGSVNRWRGFRPESIPVLSKIGRSWFPSFLHYKGRHFILYMQVFKKIFCLNNEKICKTKILHIPLQVGNFAYIEF